MKRLLLVAGILTGMTAYANALNPELLKYDEFRASNTWIVTSSSFASVISSYPAILRAVQINTPGSVGAKLELFNASHSTFAPSAIRIGTIMTSSAPVSFNYDRLSLSSGLAISNSGGTPADITIIFREK